MPWLILTFGRGRSSEDMDTVTIAEQSFSPLFDIRDSGGWHGARRSRRGVEGVLGRGVLQRGHPGGRPWRLPWRTVSTCTPAVSAGVDGGDLAAYFKDDVAAGAYSAMEKDVFVACSAGNKGPGIVTLANGAPWLMYAESDANPMAIISPGVTLTGVQPAPVVVGFSSRGPNLVSPAGVLKPDVIVNPGAAAKPKGRLVARADTGAGGAPQPCGDGGNPIQCLVRVELLDKHGL
ncbi:subtilisin-like protease SDD1 [Panicum miliaceum]|uniref:Subtilisin-like protease SDD1 n=1 Tax=Panicum miliaceum TaxID=4540 RepID=A0A3L6S7S7_PANMI|nr:subtilisin-like protease SDD1 [Panicum miliaceum]